MNKSLVDDNALRIMLHKDYCNIHCVSELKDEHCHECFETLLHFYEYLKSMEDERNE